MDSEHGSCRQRQPIRKNEKLYKNRSQSCLNKSAGTSQQPSQPMKILVKTNKSQVKEQEQEKSTSKFILAKQKVVEQGPSEESTSTQEQIVRSLSTVLDKKIHTALNILRSEKRTAIKPKTIKLIDSEFNFIQDQSWIDVFLMSDGNQFSSNQSNQPVNGANSSTITNQNTSSTNINSSTHQSFCIVAAVGLDGTGKSSVLNELIDKQVFDTRANLKRDQQQVLLSPCTTGIDLHVTDDERLFLLDTQPLLSASILDDLLNKNASTHSYHHYDRDRSNVKHYYNSSLHLNSGINSKSPFATVVGFEIAETENFAYIYSLQILTFLLTVCDHIILVIDSLVLDAYLFKLLSTALMMVGESVLPKANIVVYLRSSSLDQQQQSTTIFNSPREDEKILKMYKDSLVTMLGQNVSLKFINNNINTLIASVLKPQPRNLLIDQQILSSINYQSEKLWLQTAQRFWDQSIKNGKLFSDYAKFLP